MRRIGIIASSVRPASAPTVTISATTNYNQNIATFNGTVSANGSTTTTIKFQVSTNGGSTWSDAAGGTTISNTSSQNVSVYYNATGLTEGTAYKVRLTATNGVGTSTTTATTGDFTSWSLQVYERSTSGGTTFTIPTVTPTGGSAVAVSIYDIIMFGAGGGGAYSGGAGGGGYQNVASRSMTGSRSITTSVGGGGLSSYNNYPNLYGTNGGSSTLTGDLTSLTASGGGGGENPNPGSSGNGNAGGSNASYDPDGSGKGYPNWAYGGGGGAGATGSNGSASSSGTFGGNGGTGVSITSGGVTRTGGAGGGGNVSVSQPVGTSTSGSQGSNNSYGSGGNSNDSGGANGQAGYIRFRYYAASAQA